jgi:hypothetical protein
VDHARSRDALAGGEHALGEQIDAEQSLGRDASAPQVGQPPAGPTARVEKHAVVLEHLWHRFQERAHRLFAHVEVAGVLGAPCPTLAWIAAIAGVHTLDSLELSGAVYRLGRGAISLHQPPQTSF